MARASERNGGRAAVIVPPGWTLVTGGPHLAVALLAGSLRASGVQVEISDWNLSLAERFGATMTEDQVRSCSTSNDVEQLNSPYFSAQDTISAHLQGTGTAWDLQLGYSDTRHDWRRPEEVREAMGQRSPLDDALFGLASELLDRHAPSIVGISITVPGQILPAFYSARALRQTGFDGVIVLGGNVVTRLASNMALPWVFDWVDALALWQGEISMPALCSSVESRDWTGIPNLIWFDHGEIRINETRTLPPSEFAAPEFEGLPLRSYWGSQFLPAVGSRGCYYGKCHFCSIPYAWGNAGYLGNETPGAVVRQIERGLAHHGVRRFKFIDEALHPGLIRTVADMLVDRSMRVEFEGYARFDHAWLSSEFLSKLAKAGLRKVYLGLELAPSDTRVLLNKSDQANVLSLLKRLSDHGILAHAFCLFGFPGTGADEAIATVDFAMKHEVLIDTLDIFPFYYATHTKVAGVRAVDEPEAGWALEHLYEPASPGVLSMEDVLDLTVQLEGYVWRSKPRWLHPVYRMASPWTPRVQ